MFLYRFCYFSYKFMINFCEIQTKINHLSVSEVESADKGATPAIPCIEKGENMVDSINSVNFAVLFRNVNQQSSV